MKVIPNAETLRHPNKDTGVVGIYLDKTTKGLRAEYTFHAEGNTYRRRTLEEAIEAKREINERNN